VSSADTLLARIRDLSHLPASQQPGDWAELATAVNALDDLLSMGAGPPAAWVRETWKPYAPKTAPSYQPMLSASQ
jgi:hypothetical protein